MSLKKPTPCLTYRAKGVYRVTPDTIEYKPYGSNEVFTCFSERALHELFHIESSKDENGWNKVSALIKAMESSQDSDNIILFTMQNISIVAIWKEDFEKIFQDTCKSFEE